MRWQRGYRSDDVEIRRGGGAGGLLSLLPLLSRSGIGGTIALVALYLAGRALLGDSMPLLGGAGEPAPERDDERVQFVSFVFDDLQTTWQRLFAAQGADYRKARLVVFHGQTATGCGHGSAAVGPFYCPEDGQVYIDLRFHDELHRRFGAPGDFAQAYVIAHEVGHHVQNQIGVFERHADRGRGRDSVAVRQELQADCLAGVWAHASRQRQLLESGDAEEALRAAAAIGDDVLQRRAGDAVQPESWTHGSAEQRMRWFRRGLDSGSIADCDTFAAAAP
jgi:hypothetical protein